MSRFPRPDRPLPYVNAAILCRRIDSDAHGQLSLVGIYESGVVLDQGPAEIQLTGYVRVHAGDATGHFMLSGLVRVPSGAVVTLE